MESVEIIGFKRANLGKKDAKSLRTKSEVPCVLYGGKDQVHFSAPMILFRELVYTENAYFVELNIEGEIRKAILQDIQFHPVSEMILHADFLELFDDKEVKLEVPVKVSGTSPGILAGGRLAMKLGKMKIKSLPANMPSSIEIDISELELGKSIRVGDIEKKNFEILHNDSLPICTVAMTRATRQADAAAEGEEATATAE